MENQNNNMQEMEDLRSQLAEFKNRLDQQKIINEKLLGEAVHGQLSWIHSMAGWATAAEVVLIPLLYFVLKMLGCSIWSFVAVALLLIGEMIFNILNTHSINREHLTSCDVVTAQQKLITFKRREKIQTAIEVPLIVIWVAWIAYEMHTGNITSIIVGFLIGLGIGCYLFFREMRSVNKAIRQYEEFME